MKNFNPKKIFAFILVILLVIFLLLSLIDFPTNSQNSNIYDMTLQGKFITIDNIKTYYVDTGNISDPVILLIHGFGGSVYSWRENIQPLFDKGFRVLAIDLKGFGLSDKSYFEDYSHKAQAEFLYKFISKLGVSKVILIGHSMGGNIATTFAMNYPEEVTSLIIVDGAIVKDNVNGAGILFDIKGVRNIFKIAIQNIFTKDRFADFLRSAYINQSVISTSVIDNYYLPLQTSGWDDALAGISRDGGKNQIPKALDSLDIPVLIVWGEKDPWIDVSNAYMLNKEIPNSKLEIITGVGHLPMEENHEVFNSTVIDFLGIIN